MGEGKGLRLKVTKYIYEALRFDEFLYVFGDFKEVSSICTGCSIFVKEQGDLLAKNETSRHNVFGRSQSRREFIVNKRFV